MATPANKNSSLGSLWEERMLGIELPPIDWNRPITHEEVEQLLRLYPFLQMLSSEPEWDSTITVQFVTAPSGWIVHDYGQAMSVSPGMYLFGYKPKEEEAQEEGEGGETAEGATGTGRGTLTQQILDTSEFMVQLALERGWPGIELIAGTPFMQWTAWMAAQDRGISLVGYEPSKSAQVKRDRIIRLRGEFERYQRSEMKPSG